MKKLISKLLKNKIVLGVLVGLVIFGIIKFLK